MRQLTLLAALLVGAGVSHATDYYVSPNGNDSDNGTSPATAWKTIWRVNQSTYSYQPGDRILFERGGTWRGEVIMGVSGSQGQPITVGAYGTGNLPVIKGSELVTGWTPYQGNIWMATVATPNGGPVEQVYVNGARMERSRYPNTGWLRSSQAGGTQLHSNDLDQPDGYWNGATAVVRTAGFAFDTLRVASYANGTLTFTSPIYYTMGSEPWGFFMTRKLAEVDSPGEWYFDRAQQRLYLWAPGGADPNGLQVEAAMHRAGVNCYWQRHHLVVRDIAFRHQVLAGVLNDGASQVTVTGCDFRRVFHGIRSAGTDSEYSGNSFRDTYATAIASFGNAITIDDNDFLRIAMLDGEGESSMGYFGIRAEGWDLLVRGNRMDSIGYIGLAAGGNSLVEHNVVLHALTTLNDGGGITFDGTDGLVLQDNIVGDPIGSYANGAPMQYPHTQRLGIGIYFGNNSIKNTIVRRNTVYGCPQTGIHVDHTMATTGIQVKDNILFDNKVQLTMSDYSTPTGAGAAPPYYMPSYNDVYSGNIMYCLSKDQVCMRQYHCHSAVPVEYGSFSNNRYFNPYNELSINIVNFMDGYQNRNFSLERWQAEKNLDAGSTRSPLRLPGYATIQELTGNLVVNGDFPDNVNGWTGWPTNAQVSHVTDHLDNGALKAYLPDNSIYPNFILNNPDPFPIQDGAWYRVRCSVQSNTNGQVTVGVKGLSTEGNPYTTWQQEIPFGTERRDLEMYFQSDLTDQARIRFQNQWTDPMYYLDNVEVTRVNVQPLDPHEKNKLLINDQLQAANFDLPAGCWSDVLGNPLTSPVSIPAFGSIVIYRLPDEDCDNISTGLETPGGPETPPALYPNPAERGGELRFAPRGQARLTLVDMRGTTALQMDLANGASSILLPSSIAPGPYVVRIQSDHGRDVQRLIIR